MIDFTLAFLNNLSPWEIGLIFLLILLLFGAKRIPELARSLGKSIREFKKATRGIENEIREAVDEEEEAASPPKHTVAKNQPAPDKSEEDASKH